MLLGIANTETVPECITDVAVPENVMEESTTPYEYYDEEDTEPLVIEYSSDYMPESHGRNLKKVTTYRKVTKTTTKTTTKSYYKPATTSTYVYKPTSYASYTPVYTAAYVAAVYVATPTYYAPTYYAPTYVAPRSSYYASTYVSLASINQLCS